MGKVYLKLLQLDNKENQIVDQIPKANDFKTKEKNNKEMKGELVKLREQLTSLHSSLNQTIQNLEKENTKLVEKLSDKK